MTPEEKANIVDIEALQDRLGLQFHDPALLERAMTHRSFTNEYGEKVEDNERLEFLGDATLNFLSGDLLYQSFPDQSEGWLTRMRSALVRTESLAKAAAMFQLGEAMRMGKGEEANGGRQRKTNLCDAFEALVGAVYLDQGVTAVRAFIWPILEQRLQEVVEEASYWDARTLLQEWSQSETGITPVYDIVGESGPEHEKRYEIEAKIGGDVVGRGYGRSKRAAAQSAARDALKIIKEQGEDNDLRLPPKRD